MNLDEHPQSIFTTDTSQTKVGNYYYLYPAQKPVVVIWPHCSPIWFAFCRYKPIIHTVNSIIIHVRGSQCYKVETSLKWTLSEFEKMTRERQGPLRLYFFWICLLRESWLYEVFSYRWGIRVFRFSGSSSHFSKMWYWWFSQWRHQIAKSKKRGFTNSYLH